jgi:uncharacterized protein (TIGR02996 family)
VTDTYFSHRLWTPMVKAIRDNPDDDTLKLALCDELEDIDDPGAEVRAKLIRTSVELANLPKPPKRVTPISILEHDAAQYSGINLEKSGLLIDGRELLKIVELVHMQVRDEEITGVEPGDVVRIDRGSMAGRFGQGYVKVAHIEDQTHTDHNDRSVVIGRWYDFYKDQNYARRKELEQHQEILLQSVITTHQFSENKKGLTYVNWHKGFPVAIHCSSSWWVNNAKQALDTEPFTELRVPFVPNIVVINNKYYWVRNETKIHDSITIDVAYPSNTFPELFRKVYGAKLRIVETNSVRDVGEIAVTQFTLVFTTTHNPAGWAPRVIHTHSLKPLFGYHRDEIYIRNIVGSPMPNVPGLWEVFVTFELGIYSGLNVEYSNFEAHIPDLF